MAGFSLPNEIWCMIFSYLPLAPKKNATATCKLWSRLIREDPKLSGHILISWHNMERAIERSQWNLSNWPGLETLKLKKLELFKDSRVSVLNVIEKLSLPCHHMKTRSLRLPSLKAVLFHVDLTPIQTNGQSLLMYQPYTDQIFGLGQELDSIQKWKQFELNMRGLKILKSIASRNPPQVSWPVLAELEATLVPSMDVLLMIASPAFQMLLQLMERRDAISGEIHI